MKPARRLSLLKHLQESDEAMVSHAAAELRAAAACVQRSDRPALSVLLAEDDQVNALLARTMLEKAGHRVMHAVNGQEATEMIAAALAGYGDAPGMPDLVLMDMAMPGLTGWRPPGGFASSKNGMGRAGACPFWRSPPMCAMRTMRPALPPAWTGICPSPSTGAISKRRSPSSRKPARRPDAQPAHLPA